MDPRGELERIFGFPAFRPGQSEAVAAALANRDALVVMPTGSGKSLGYQLPALLRDDLTLVVSPLVSLMHDQVQALRRVAPGRVEVVNGQQGSAANDQALARVATGETRLLYVAPERFAARGFAQRIGVGRVGLFVVDEAHCVSQWGHDFRPEYFALADAARRLGARATMAVTATATPAVADDIVRRLALRSPVRVRTGFDRPNLEFDVVRCGGAVEKRRRLAEALRKPRALPAIVYVGTREASEALARHLTGGLSEQVLPYHAGLDRGLRSVTQERFMTGACRVIVATNAFGMGIDKRDVRTVCHATVPASLEAYYQEAGRAGRDGLPARCLLLVEKRDKGLHVFFIQRSRIPEGAFEQVAERLRWAGLDGRYDVAAAELLAATGLTGKPRSRREDEQELLRAIVGHLARAGVVVPELSSPERLAGRVCNDADARALAICRGLAHDAERARWSQYRAIWGYVERASCRRATLLAHFGDTVALARSSECCDVCRASALAERAA
ncbi:MAG: RecQ family ATP-dependent DNA helicase [Solirubrobacteraceae bacterium]